MTMHILGIILCLLIASVSSAFGQLNAAQRLEAWEKGVASRARATGPQQSIIDNGPVNYDDQKRQIKNALSSLPKTKFAPETYRDFLNLPRSGSVRLFNSNTLKVQTISKRSWQNGGFNSGVNGDGLSYSIRKNQYTYQMLSDFTLDGKKLVFGGALNQSLVVDLGDIPPGSIDLHHPAIRDAFTFQPSTDVESVLKREAEIEKGIRVGEYMWTRSVPAKINATYLARVIAYNNSLEKKKNDSGNATTFSFLRADERRDIIMVFRVVAIEEDGGVTLIWRELIRNKSPKLLL